MNTPCKDCTRRSTKCHSTCKEYHIYKSKQKLIKSKYELKRKTEISLNNYEYENSQKRY